MPDPIRTMTRVRSARPAGRLTATAAALLTLLVLLAGCSQDLEEGEQPALGGEVTEPEQGIQEAGEQQLAPGAGVADAGEAVEPEEQAVGDPAFVQGDFGEVPIPPGAEPFDDATVENDVTAQSFRVLASSPVQVIEFYRGELPELGWTPGQQDSSGQATESGQPAQVQATWTKDGQTLLVAAAALDDRDSQLSLSLSGV